MWFGWWDGWCIRGQTHIQQLGEVIIPLLCELNVKFSVTSHSFLKISDVVSKNKYTLIDFWASWCGPCRREMPNVVAAYKEYNKKGFGIVGVSLDSDAEAWKKAIKDMGMTWDHMSDVKGWQCEGAALYGVNSIPATVLVAQDGTIIARNLRGEAIKEKLAELLK